MIITYVVFPLNIIIISGNGVREINYLVASNELPSHHLERRLVSDLFIYYFILF